METTCNNTHNSIERIIKSPNYPNNYPDDVLCEWTLISNPGTQIVFYIKELSTENVDEFEIFDGKSPSDGLITVMYDDVWNETIISKSNEVLIRFTSDYGTNYKGFYVIYGTKVKPGRDLRTLYFCEI